MAMIIKREYELYHAIVENIFDGFAYNKIVLDENGRPKDYIFLEVNEKFEKLIGMKKEELVGKKCTEVFKNYKEKAIKYIDACGKIALNGDTIRFEEYWEWVDKWVSIFVYSDKKNYFAATFMDISKIKNIFCKMTEMCCDFDKIMYLCFHDKLTGLYNRAFIEEELIRLNCERQLPLTIIMGDINGLKLVNDVFGHDVGDKFIKKIANILKSSCRKEDVVGRIGGDEFLIMLPKVSEERGYEIIKRIKESCKKENEDPIRPNISLGMATKNSITDNIMEVYKKAEEEMYNNKLIESKNLKKEIIAALTDILKVRCKEMENHNNNLKELSIKISKILNLNKNDKEALELLASLHDIGKIGIPKEILDKEDRLNQVEYNIMGRHCEIGYRIVSSIPELAHIADCILSHHEHYDGNGYPQGLKGEEIPYFARVISILDAYDNMINPKFYTEKKTKLEALEEIKKFSGTKFDPNLVQIFIKLMDKMEKYCDNTK